MIVQVESHKAGGQILAPAEPVQDRLAQIQLLPTTLAQDAQDQALGSRPAHRGNPAATLLHNPTSLPRGDLAPRLAMEHRTPGSQRVRLGPEGATREGQNEISLNLDITPTRQAPPRGLDLDGQTHGLDRILPEIQNQRLSGERRPLAEIEGPLQEGKKLP